MSGKYGNKDKIRPIWKCSSTNGFTRCIIIQETEKSYLLRKNYRTSIIGEERWSSAEWVRKKSMKLIHQIAEIYIDDYSFCGGYERKDLHSIEVRCPECEAISNISQLISQNWRWICPKCQLYVKKENYKIIYNFNTKIKEPEVKSIIKKISNDCPECGYKNNKIKDEINRVIQCQSCKVYYIGEHNSN